MSEQDDVNLWRRRATEMAGKLDVANMKLREAKAALGEIRQMGTLDDKHVQVAHVAFQALER